MAGLHFLEHFLDARQRQAVDRVAEVLVDRLLRVRAFRPEEADLQRLLLGQAGRHDLAEQPHQHFVVERAVVAIDDPAQHLRLALRTVVVDRRRELALGLADLVGELRAFGDQLLDLAIDAVDALAQCRQIRLGSTVLGGLLRRRLAALAGRLLRSPGLASCLLARLAQLVPCHQPFLCWKSRMKAASACTPASGIAL